MKPVCDGRAPAVTTLALAAALLIAPPFASAQNTPPDMPRPIDPPGFSQTTANPPTFSAVTGADPEFDPQWVEIAVYQDDTLFVTGSDFAGPYGAGDTVTWTPPDTLHENWFYFWTARATDGTDTTPKFGHLAFFTVNAVNEPPSQVQLIAPIGDSTVFTVLPWFHWTHATDPDFYDSLTYTVGASHDDCLITFIEMDLVDTFYRPEDSLGPNRHYAWSVYAEDQGGEITRAESDWFWTYLPGDVDLNRVRTSADIILMVNYVFKGGTLLVPDCVADLNVDGRVTAADVIEAVLYIFKFLQPPPRPVCDL